jgi:hypothetical protein
MRNQIVCQLAIALLCAGLDACTFDGDDAQLPLLAAEDSPPGQTFFIGGRIEGATGALTLQNSNGRTLTLDRDGSFAFETQMVSSAIYNVTVVVHPNAQTCLVAHGAGTVKSADIRDVTVTCTPDIWLTAKR